MDDELDGKTRRRVRLEYRDRGKFEAQLQVANDLLIFRCTPTSSRFDANHLIWQKPLRAQADQENSYCGLISIYNFLSDSFKFNRNADEGYLIGRIFNQPRTPLLSKRAKQQTRCGPPHWKVEIGRMHWSTCWKGAIAYSLNSTADAALRGRTNA